jgi:hypothetical protein
MGRSHSGRRGAPQPAFTSVPRRIVAANEGNIMASEAGRDGYETALRGKVAAWQAALDAYLAAKAIDGPVGDVAHNGGSAHVPPSAAFDLPMGALRKKTVPDAITLYLSAGHRKQTNKEIASGILAGGLETGAKNLEASVAAALFRLKKAGIVLRFADGWDLAEHYPDHIRKKLEPTTTTTAIKKSAKAKKKRAAKATPTQATESKTAG